MISFHCVSHRVELAVKDVSEFNTVDDLYKGIYKLLNKGEIKAAAKVQNIIYYVLPRITRTRFAGHHRKAFNCCLNLWPALICAFENVVDDKKTTTAIRNKVVPRLDNPSFKDI